MRETNKEEQKIRIQQQRPSPLPKPTLKELYQQQTSQIIMDDDQKGFYVEPKRDCPHIDASYTPSVHALASPGPCASCADEQENWACLTCSKRFCSRYVNVSVTHSLCSPLPHKTTFLFHLFTIIFHVGPHG